VFFVVEFFVGGDLAIEMAGEDDLFRVVDHTSDVTTRVILGRNGATPESYGLWVYDPSGNLLIGADGFGLNVVGSANIGELTVDKLVTGTLAAGVILKVGSNTITLNGTENAIIITDEQLSPVERIRLGKLGPSAADYGIEIRNADGDVVMDADGLGALSVKTIHVEDGAITTYSTASTAGTNVCEGFAGAGSPTYEQVQSVSHISSGEPITISIAFSGTRTGTPSTTFIAARIWYRVKRGSTILYSVEPAGDDIIWMSTGERLISDTILDTPGAGTFTYSVEVACANQRSSGATIVGYDAAISKRTILCFEPKK
jgi:hypothetical protein